MGDSRHQVLCLVRKRQKRERERKSERLPDVLRDVLGDRLEKAVRRIHEAMSRLLVEGRERGPVWGRRSGDEDEDFGSQEAARAGKPRQSPKAAKPLSRREGKRPMAEAVDPTDEEEEAKKRAAAARARAARIAGRSAGSSTDVPP